MSKWEQHISKEGGGGMEVVTQYEGTRRVGLKQAKEGNMQRSWTPSGVCGDWEGLECSWLLSRAHRSEEVDEQIPALWLLVARHPGTETFMEASLHK